MSQHCRSPFIGCGATCAREVGDIRAGIWSRIVDRRMGVEARPQEQGVFAVLNLDLIDTMIQSRHLLNLKRRAKQVKLLVVTFPEVQENDSRLSVRLVRLEIHTLLFL
jgi:hypothetical protein